MSIREIYNTSLSLFTDMYQITMGQAYFHNNTHEQLATFNLYYRKPPFKSHPGIIACGITAIKEIMCLGQTLFLQSDIEFLTKFKGNDGNNLFSTEYLDYLSRIDYDDVDIWAVEEGIMVLPNAPILKITGPILKCQLFETLFLTIINFNSLIATKAHTIVSAANLKKKKSVIELGTRRAQGIDGSLSASYAAYIGGVDGTSNVLASQLYGIPCTGTMAHSYIMSYDSEMEAFTSYANAMPHNCVLLVDTYDTIEGIKKAILVGQSLKKLGHTMTGIRLDSGDLLALSKSARIMLDAGGLETAKIIASNDLDEDKILYLEGNDAPIDIYGVGTQLVTSYTNAALGGVYKLSAIQENGIWVPKVKLSNDAIKVSWPGRQQVYRISTEEYIFAADILVEEGEKPPNFPGIVSVQELLVPLSYHDGDIERAKLRATLNSGSFTIAPYFKLHYSFRMQLIRNKLIHSRGEK